VVLISLPASITVKSALEARNNCQEKKQIYQGYYLILDLREV
jgi:hypothetical protein